MEELLHLESRKQRHVDFSDHSVADKAIRGAYVIRPHTNGRKFVEEDLRFWSRKRKLVGRELRTYSAYLYVIHSIHHFSTENNE